MSNGRNLILIPFLAGLLAACASTPPPGPVQVTRFHDSAAASKFGEGVFFIESAPGNKDGSLEDAPYKAAVARELAMLGYTEGSRGDATVIAQINVDRYAIDSQLRERGPVSVGVGGSTGSYGSGVGLGIGINLGGNKNRDRVGTDLAVTIRDIETKQNVWEGRAQLEVGRDSAQAQPAANASIIANALFRDFPGGNGETIEIEVSE